MNRKLMMAVLGCAAAFACAAVGRESRQAPVELLDAKGVSAPALSIESGGALTFVNGDVKPHQIYSPDCPELASTALRPGQLYTLSGPARAARAHLLRHRRRAEAASQPGRRLHWHLVKHQGSPGTNCSAGNPFNE